METFVVRLWVPGATEPPVDGELRGTVVHVVTGHGAAFHSDSELLEFVRRSVRDQHDPCGRDEVSTPVRAGERGKG